MINDILVFIVKLRYTNGIPLLVLKTLRHSLNMHYSDVRRDSGIHGESTPIPCTQSGLKVKVNKPDEYKAVFW